ncbi:Mss4-like protein [Chaetoceros tenuissimus]|uniref:peptide-methionine (R)-S-oxide reductase n=1 Tax=Chaetoceros tenuissimus TaxID=426638 RepID=A0AAD3CEG4_9STRA|nr:Mss4-like protein [Chaetoceros tenuissimus]
MNYKKSNRHAVVMASLLLMGLSCTSAFSLLPKNKISSTTLYASNDTDNEESSSQIGTYNPFRLAVLKLGLTELRYTSPLNYEKREGIYKCANCNSELFSHEGKYDSGSGWPSFYKTFAEEKVAYKREWDGRIECACKNCGGHLGHAFPDGPKLMDIDAEILERLPSDDLKTFDLNNQYSRLPRYCINGAALKFYAKDE